MKYIKTYGINGLLEWHGTIHSNGIKMNVSFTNGSVTAYGVAPATFTTKNELTQHIIESSQGFKSGRIKLVRKQEIEVKEVPVEVAAEEPHPAEKLTVETAGEAAGTTAGEADEDGDAPTKVKVDSKTEAIEWLKDNYPDKGYTSVGLRGKEAFEKAQKECGVVFEF